MVSLLKLFLFPFVLYAALLGSASGGRTGSELESEVKLHMDNILKVENTVLREEVKDLRAKLRVEASGSFAWKRQEASGPSSPLLSSSKRKLAATSIHHDTRHLLSVDLQDISHGIAQNAAAVARMMDTKGATDDKSTRDGGYDRKVLFVISSSSKFYDTRIRWAQDTWAKRLHSSQFVVIGDAQAPNLTGVNIHRTLCKPHDLEMASCCKHAEAVVVAQMVMQQNPELEWAYLVDDDSYIRVAALEQALLSQPPSHPRTRGIALGNYGCATASCSDSLCGGSGYAANRWAVETLAATDPEGFVQEVMRNCNKCGGDPVHNQGLWGDAGLSEVIVDRGIERRTLDGIYGWMMDRSCLQFSLETEKEPLMYHMIRTRPQMELLHRLFSADGEQMVTPVSEESSTEGLGGCVQFHGNVQCAASRDDEDRPWHRGPPKCKRSHMPRLPAMLGAFTLFLLFAVLAMLIWAGFRHPQWEEWKLHSINRPNYPIQK